jgi:hypothetical protein
MVTGIMTSPKPRHLLTKRPYRETAARVVAAFDRNPQLSSVDLGERLGLHPAYVRKALARNQQKLKGSKCLTPTLRPRTV